MKDVLATARGRLRRVRIPRLSAYLLIGLLIGPYMGNVLREDLAGVLGVLISIATTLIALIAGLSLNIERLGPRFFAITRLAAATLAVAITGLFALAWAVWPWLPLAPDATGLPRVAMALLVALILVSFSPTMTVAVTADSGARGRLSQLVIAMVILADLAILVLFSFAMQVARLAFSPGGDTPQVGLLARFAWLRRLPGRLIGMGLRPEHPRTR